MKADQLCRKKKKSKAKDESERKHSRERVKELLESNEVELVNPPSGSGQSTLAIASSSRKTEAERRFEEVQKKRVSIGLSFCFMTAD